MLDLGQCFVTFKSAARDVQILQVNIKIAKRKIGRIYNWVGWFSSVFHFLFVYKFDLKGISDIQLEDLKAFFRICKIIIANPLSVPGIRSVL